MLPRRLLAASMALPLYLFCAAGAQAAEACSTATPAANAKDPVSLEWSSDKAIEANFTAVRMAEGCNVPLVLPAGYDGMAPPQQLLWLINAEREVRGLAAIRQDSTLLGEIAQNHAQEEATYGYFNHPSPVNEPPPVSNPQNLQLRDSVNPALAHGFVGEDAAAGYPIAAEAMYSYMYFDGPGSRNSYCTPATPQYCWGHRTTILNKIYNWIGIGFLNAPGSMWGTYWVDDFAEQPASYTPPAAADTGKPVMGAITYANGAAKVAGVGDSPQNVLDTGATPTTAAITSVVFYTNKIVEAGGAAGASFNTVAATQTAVASGTWTANITVNAGEVLHAVAVDGSGNFTDMATAPPAMTLAPGENTVALPAATTETPAAEAAVEEAPAAEAAAAKAGSAVPAATRTAAGLVRSINRQAHRKIVVFVRVYINGRWHTYVPRRSKNFDLFTNEGVIVRLSRKLRWRAPAGDEPLAAPTLKLHRGWNFVAAPYPIVHMTCHATRLELAKQHDKLLQITVGTSPQRGLIMRPNRKGQWGNDLSAVINDSKGFWIKDAGSATWVPSPTNYASPGPATG